MDLSLSSCWRQTRALIIGSVLPILHRSSRHVALFFESNPRVGNSPYYLTVEILGDDPGVSIQVESTASSSFIDLSSSFLEVCAKAF